MPPATPDLCLGYPLAELEARGAGWTAREIVQQPAMLGATAAVVAEARAALAALTGPFAADPRARVILTGAGTSAFIGECLAPWLGQRLAARVEAIATTDIVAAPRLWLEPDTPTLLVSFGRSGNSPESLGAVDLANRLVRPLAHLAITCHGEGALARAVAAAERGLALVLPEPTHDRGFAMTSSFTAMMLAALLALAGPEPLAPRIAPIAAAMADAIATGNAPMRALAGQGPRRVVYLGSQGFKGLAREAALKLLELTNGRLVTAFDSTLGFRHGPKSIVDGATAIIVMLANDPLTRRYDLDLIAELARDARMAALMVIAADEAGIPADVARHIVPGLAGAADVELLFPYIALPQLLAFHASLALGLTPDNPDPSGAVNRVVKGVTLYGLG